MAHQQVEGDGLRTTYAYAPRVSISAAREGPASVHLSFVSSAVYRDGQEVRVTQLTFKRVVAFTWNDFEFHRLPSNSSDVELGLIEITDSTLVADIRSTDRYIGEGLHHFRICFDDHGTYDIVCERLTVTYDVSKADDLYTD